MTEPAFAVPEFLYRYRTLKLGSHSCEDVEGIVAHNQIQFSSPKWLNDPFDCKVSENLDVPDSTKREWLQERCRREILGQMKAQASLDLEKQVARRFDELWPRCNEIALNDIRVLQRYIDSCGILCLSERCDDILMWSHYTDGHRGICLKFQSSYLRFPVGEIKPQPFKNVYRKPERVNYSHLYPETRFVNSPPWELYFAWIMTKSCHWRYEQEWRIILHAEKPKDPKDSWDPQVKFKATFGDYNSLPQDSLTGIIFGCEITDDDERMVREWLERRGAKVSLFRAERHPRRYELIIKGTE